MVGDPIRGAACLVVVLMHVILVGIFAAGYSEQLQADPKNFFATLYGPPGQLLNGLLVTIDIFFALSAYLLVRPFLRAFLDNQPTPSIALFFRNRALRVLPVLWLVLLIVAVATEGESWLDVLRLAVFVGDFQSGRVSRYISQGWSLNVEARFYLILPVVSLALIAASRGLGNKLTRRTRIVLVGLISVAWFYASAAALAQQPHANTFAAHSQYFVPGILLALAEYVLPARVRGRRGVATISVASFAAGVLLILSCFYIGRRAPQFIAIHVVALGIGTMLAGPLLWQWSGRPPWHFLDNKPLHWLGQRSYPLFLVHQLVLGKIAPHLVVGGFIRTALLTGAVGVPISLLVAGLIHRFVELPAMSLKVSQNAGLPPSEGPTSSGRTRGLNSRR